MPDGCSNRLIVLGGRRTLRKFQNSDWLAVMAGRHAEPLEFAPTRFACQFETPGRTQTSCVRPFPFP